MPVIKWHDSLILEVYELAARGVNDGGILDALDIDSNTYMRWRRNRPVFADARERGMAAFAAKKRPPVTEKTFGDYVYCRLGNELKALWDKLTAISVHSHPLQQTAQVLQGHGEDVRQALFVHAMCASSFNQSDACRMVGITRETLLAWQGNETFAKLIAEVWWHRKNFFEGCLVAACARGEVNAIVFANKTQNKDRGYGDTLKLTGGLAIDATARVDVRVQHVPVETLGLIPLDVRRKMLAQMEAAHAAKPKLLESRPA